MGGSGSLVRNNAGGYVQIDRLSNNVGKRRSKALSGGITNAQPVARPAQRFHKPQVVSGRSIGSGVHFTSRPAPCDFHVEFGHSRRIIEKRIESVCWQLGVSGPWAEVTGIVVRSR